MNFTIIFAALMQLINDLPQILSIWNAATSNASAAVKIKEITPLSAPILEQIGSTLFPNLAPELHVVAGAMTMNLNAIQWLQESLNIVNKPLVPLHVDGVVGPLTLAQIHAFQAAHGFDTTGFMSDAENALIMALLAQSPSPVPATPVPAPVVVAPATT